MSNLRIALILGSALGIVAVAGPANATHKNWQLKNTGSQCSFISYPADVPLPAGNQSIRNEASYARYAVCPVTLAGRWGSSEGLAFPVPRWAATLSAKAIIVNNNTNGSVFDCMVRARLATEALYYSSRATTTTTGAQALLVAKVNQWGGTLEAAQAHIVRSMDFDCRIPGQPTNGSASYIDGYQVKICQRAADCLDGSSGVHEGPPLDGIEFDNQYNYVQTSGFECTVGDHHEADKLERGYVGIKNIGTYSFGVFCPLTQPSDDSWWHDRRAAQTTVHYTGGPFRPGCRLTAGSYSTSFYPLTSYTSPEFVAGASGTVVQPGFSDLNVGKDVALGVWCTIQPGQTIKGITALLSQTHISGGQ